MPLTEADQADCSVHTAGKGFSELGVNAVARKGCSVVLQLKEGLGSVQVRRRL